MALSCSNLRFLALTAREADCVQGINRGSIEKAALAREMSEVSQKAYKMMQEKQVSFYANSKYNKMNYNYLMGYGSNYASIFNNDKYPLKEENSMILTDFKGQVVLSDDYAKALTKVLGSSAMNKNGRGGTFSPDKIPAILAELCPGFEEETFKTVINGDKVSSEYTASTPSGAGGEVVVDNSDKMTEKIQSVVDFYMPIFTAAAANGWTTEYNRDMNLNDDYVSDALVTGTFQLATVNDHGEYDEGCTLTYFITAGLVAENNSADVREEAVAWREAELARISEKETRIDLLIDELSTELEAIKTEKQSLETFIQDSISSTFDWGSA